MSTRTIRMLKQTVCGGVSVKPGDVVDATLRDAHYLVSTKAAEPCDEKPKRRGKANRMIDQAELQTRNEEDQPE